jgi:hypothetical protein
VLLADDHPPTRELTAAMLTSEFLPDVIVHAITRPCLDGIESDCQLARLVEAKLTSSDPQINQPP